VLTRSVHSGVIQIDGVILSLLHIASANEYLAMDLEAATAPLLEEPEKPTKRRVLSSKVVPLTCDGHRANIVQIIDQEEGRVMATHTLVLTRGADLWNVMLTGNPDEVSEISKRLLHSIRLTNAAGADPGTTAPRKAAPATRAKSR
jgi:hypothetical protein